MAYTAPSGEFSLALDRLADLHLIAARVAGNEMADRCVEALGTLAEYLPDSAEPADSKRLRAAFDIMLDAVQAQDRISQTLELVRQMLKARGQGRGATVTEEAEVLRELLRRSKALQPALATDVGNLIGAYLTARGRI
jgi:hypothetical protein